jgi:exopolyphosphatase/guanosine-5'-triphosphate,3'-diphosphate pyrophosphatase
LSVVSSTTDNQQLATDHMKIAVIDLGTNTFNLLIAETDDKGGFTTLYNEKLPVKLGEGGINKGFITEAAFMRGLEAMDNYASTIKQWKCERTLAFATSAVRNASNGNKFVDDTLTRTGIEVQVITGEMEAEFISMGVRQAVTLTEEPSLIIDIGGGSTEFIIVDNKKILWKQSFEIGASRLLQRFTPSDPIKPGEITQIAEYILAELKPLWTAAEKLKVKELIGASGSFESLAELVNMRFHSLPGLEEKTECDFIMEQCGAIHAEILASTRDERLKMKGLIAMRVDLIVVSAVLVETVVSRLDISRMKLSAYSLKEGVLWRFLNQ